MGSARWPFRTIWLSMHYKEGPCRPQSPLLHVDIERRLEVPFASQNPRGYCALRASAVVDYEAWTCRDRVITLKFIIWFHLKCFRRTKHGNDIWYRENVLTYTITFKFCVLFQENVLSYTKSSTRDNYGDRCIALGLSITIFWGKSVRSEPCYSAEFSAAFSAASASLKHWRHSGS